IGADSAPFASEVCLTCYNLGLLALRSTKEGEMQRGFLPRVRLRFLLAMAAALAASTVSAVAAKATPIAPVTFCLNGETVTFTDTTDRWRGFFANSTTINFLTIKAQTTGVFYIVGKNGKLHPVTVSLGP